MGPMGVLGAVEASVVVPPTSHRLPTPVLAHQPDSDEGTTWQRRSAATVAPAGHCASTSGHGRRATGSLRSGTVKPRSASVARRAHCSNRGLRSQQDQPGSPSVAKQATFPGQGDTRAELRPTPEVIAELVVSGAKPGGGLKASEPAQRIVGMLDSTVILFPQIIEIAIPAVVDRAPEHPGDGARVSSGQSVVTRSGAWPTTLNVRPRFSSTVAGAYCAHPAPQNAAEVSGDVSRLLGSVWHRNGC